MSDSLTLEQKKSRRGVLALVGAGGAAAVAALLGRSNGAEAAAGDNFILGENNDAGSGITQLQFSGSTVALYVDNDSTSSFASGIKGETSGSSGTAVYGLSGGASGTGVWGQCDGGSGTGVRGSGGHIGVKGDGAGAGSIGLYGKNNPGRRALRTEGQVQMDCARRKTVSARSTKVTLPTGTRAGTNAVVLATTQGNPGNDAVIWRAYRVDSTHIRIVFNKAPANPVLVAYWVVHTG